jgi:hypothetical protein
MKNRREGDWENLEWAPQAMEKLEKPRKEVVRRRKTRSNERDSQ